MQDIENKQEILVAKVKEAESLLLWQRLDADGRKRFKNAYYKVHHVFQRLENTLS